jgi:hypothetical protein
MTDSDKGTFEWLRFDGFTSADANRYDAITSR